MKGSRNTAFSGPSKARGAILVTSLLLLLVLTVLGVAMMKMSNMQERMAGNTRDMNSAFQGAEAALRYGERTIDPFKSAKSVAMPKSEAGCTICSADWLPLDIEKPGVFDWNAEAQEYGVAGVAELSDPADEGHLAEEPRFTIAEIAHIKDMVRGHSTDENSRFFYQVTARSTGVSGLSSVVLQSTFARPE
jgi:type IV pilus assembly protein PilX